MLRQAELTVVVTDVLARPAPGVTARLLSATRLGDSGPFAADEPLRATHAAAAHVAYTMDFLDAGPDLGLYT